MGGSSAPVAVDIPQVTSKGMDNAPSDERFDVGIQTAVEILQAAGVETFESCQGGNGHAFREPTIRFHGQYPEGFRAYSVAIQHGLSVRHLRRVWDIDNGEITGPCWELTLVAQQGPVTAA